MRKPTTDFEMIHGIDTTFGGMLRAKARDAVAWLRMIRPMVPVPAQGIIEETRAAYSDIARIRIEDLGLIRTVPCFQYNPLPEKTRDDLLGMLQNQPALLYLISTEEKELLGDKAPECSGSPFGWRILPGEENFDMAKHIVTRNLLRIADRMELAHELLIRATETI